MQSGDRPPIRSCTNADADRCTGCGYPNLRQLLHVRLELDDPFGWRVAYGVRGCAPATCFLNRSSILPPVLRLPVAILQQESGGRPDAQSEAGAIGLSGTATLGYRGDSQHREWPRPPLRRHVGLSESWPNPRQARQLKPQLFTMRPSGISDRGPSRTSNGRHHRGRSRFRLVWCRTWGDLGALVSGTLGRCPRFGRCFARAGESNESPTSRTTDSPPRRKADVDRMRVCIPSARRLHSHQRDAALWGRPETSGTTGNSSQHGWRSRLRPGHRGYGWCQR